LDQYITTILDYFEWKGWPVQVRKDESLIRLKYKIQKSGVWDMYVRPCHHHKQVIFYSVLPYKIPDEQKTTVAEFLTRINFGINLGNFEMDWNDGEVRFRTSIALGNHDLDFSLIDNLVMANLVAMEDHYDGLLTVLNGTISPADAIRKIRKELDDIDFDFHS